DRGLGELSLQIGRRAWVVVLHLDREAGERAVEVAPAPLKVGALLAGVAKRPGRLRRGARDSAPGFRDRLRPCQTLPSDRLRQLFPKDREQNDAVIGAALELRLVQVEQPVVAHARDLLPQEAEEGGVPVAVRLDV